MKIKGIDNQAFSINLYGVALLPRNIFASICRTLLHQSIENNNVELKMEQNVYRQ